MQNISIGERLCALRTARNLTQEEAAAVLGVSNRTVSKWETGSSEPDLAMLGKLAQYYEVTTDFLLGLKPDKTMTASERLAEEFQGCNCEEAVQKLLDLDDLTLRLTCRALQDGKGGQTVPRTPHGPADLRSEIVTSALYYYLVSREDVNLSVKLFRTKTDYAWLSEPETQQKIADLFLFLSDTDALKLCRYLLDEACPGIFTAGFAARQAGIEAEKAGELLKATFKIGLCSERSARLKEGDVTLYQTWGSDMLLAVLVLTFEYLFKEDNYYCSLDLGKKLIGKDKEALE
ncbi:MAG: helix-turn-helix domain-containing protein [Lachnospiraceae bacterium]|nr:helix-turn-helix domain-containing protein [Lachnospiraceae bacterium]